jgi:predicted HTH transcriptional regulator
MEVWVPPSSLRPHFVKEQNGISQAYVRSRDENIQADEVIIAVWQKMKQKKGTLIRYTNNEEELFRLFLSKEKITLDDFRKGARITTKQAIETLSNLIVLRLIEQVIASPESFFKVRTE